jgi:hypothetical protein
MNDTEPLASPPPNPRILPGDGDKRHGTAYGYTGLRCRCEECRRVWKLYLRSVRKYPRKLPVDDPRHGTRNAYGYWHCRCFPCRQANSARSRAWRESA